MDSKIILSVVISITILAGTFLAIHELTTYEVFSPNTSIKNSGDIENINSGETSNISNNIQETSSGENISQSSGEFSRDSSGENLSSKENVKPQIATKVPIPENVKAVYSTGWVMGTPSLKSKMITSIKQYGYNAIVIDIKDESGQLSYNSSVQTALDIKASKRMIANIESLLKELHENNIYVIGRIVTFKDPTYASKISSIAYKKSDGSIWKDYAGNSWPNPYNKSSWNYPIELAKEAATLGFDEIQFDYIRFPSSEGRVSQISYGFEFGQKTKSDIIAEFLTKVMNELETFDVQISADVFGITTKRNGDFENIGQDFSRISSIVDVVCPMVYPSHYNFNEYGIAKPDRSPYTLIYKSIQDAQKRYNDYIDSHSGDVSGDTSKIHLAKIRPYLQDFTASWLGKGNYLTYGTNEVRAQINALHDLGIYDFTLWDPNNNYCYSALASP